MFNLDEKLLADNRNLIGIYRTLDDVDLSTKLGMINYISEKNELWITDPETSKDYIDSLLNKKPQSIKKFNKILIAEDGKKLEGDFDFLGNSVFEKDVLINGNLSIKGKSTIIDSTNAAIKDNIVELNKDETHDGVQLNQSGIAINRGTKNFFKAVLSESDKSFILASSKTIDNDKDDAYLKIFIEKNENYNIGDIEVLGSIYASSLTAENKIEGRSLTIKDDITSTNLIADKEVICKDLISKTMKSNDCNIENNIFLNGKLVFNKKYSILYNENDNNLVISRYINEE